jgi:hypothetical protein
MLLFYANISIYSDLVLQHELETKIAPSLRSSKTESKRANCKHRKKNKIKTYIKICLFRLAASGHNFLIPPLFLSFLVSLLVYKVRRFISKKKVRRWGQDTEGAVCLSKVRRSRSLPSLPRSVCILCVYDYCCSLLWLERKVLACVHD